MLVLSLSASGVVLGFAAGFALAIQMNPETADRYVLNLGSLGEWASAIASAAAVLTALWLAWKQRRDSEEKILLKQYSTRDGYWLSLVSSGGRTATVLEVFLTSKRGEQTIALSRPPLVQSGDLPRQMQYGDTYTITADASEYGRIATEWAQAHPGSSIPLLYVVVVTSLGSFEQEINPDFCQSLRTALEGRSG